MQSLASPRTACLIIIGNEILSGRTQDINLAFLATQLGALGIPMVEARVVPDIEAEVVASVNACRAKYSYVFTTGGIGPTHDDITAECIAAAFGVPLIRHPEAERRLLAHYPPEKINEARMRMANTPEGAELIDNPVSVAPGFRMDNVYVMAGVPKIMQAMFDQLKHQLLGGPPILSRTVTAHCPEGDIAAALGAIAREHPRVDIGSYPFSSFQRFGTNLVFKGVEQDAVDAAADALVAYAKEIGIETKEV